VVLLLLFPGAGAEAGPAAEGASAAGTGAVALAAGTGALALAADMMALTGERPDVDAGVSFGV